MNSINCITTEVSIVLKHMWMKLLPRIDALKVFYNVTYVFLSREM